MSQYDKLLDLLDNAQIPYREKALFFSDQIVLYKKRKKISDVIPDPMNINRLEYMGPCAEGDIIGNLTAKQAFRYLKKDWER